MKRRAYIIAAVIVLGAGFAVWRFMPDRQWVATLAAVDPGPPPDVKNVDPVAVFQRAFWKRPTEGDHILHAERREWQDEGAVKRWQWFLEVEPSPALVRYLCEDNAFLLTPKKAAAIPPNAPAWFIKDLQGAQVMAGAKGGMQLIFTPGNAKLYAMDSGGGFQPGAPEKSPALAGDAPPPRSSPPLRAKR